MERRGNTNHPSIIIERDLFGSGGVLFWERIMVVSHTELHIIFQGGSTTGARYCIEVLLPHVCLFGCAMGPQFFFMSHNGTPHHRVAVTELLESDGEF